MKILRLALSVGLLIATAKADVLSMLSARPSPVDSIFWDAQGVSELDEIASGSTTNGNGFVIAGNRTFLFMGSTFNADFLPTDGVLTTFDPNNGAPAGGFRITFDQPIYGGGAALVHSQILLRVDISMDTPPAILAFGSRNPELFQEGQATDQVLFLARVIERCFRSWLNLPL